MLIWILGALAVGLFVWAAMWCRAIPPGTVPPLLGELCRVCGDEQIEGSYCLVPCVRRRCIAMSMPKTPTLRFLTETGSVYEIDQNERQIRRLSGAGPGTSRVGNDGVWRSFVGVSGPVVGSSVLVHWRVNPESGVLETTVTSRVEHVWDAQES
jgi:hypothetical protein